MLFRSIRELSKTDDDDRDAQYFAKELAANLIGNATGGLVGLRDFFTIASQLAFEGKLYGKVCC